MKSSLAVFVMAFAAAAILTPIARAIAIRLGAFADPSGRHVHRAPIPRLGGLAVVLGFAVALVIIANLPASSLGRQLHNSPNLFWGVLLGGAGAAALGAYDDLAGARALHKLLIQMALAAGAFFLGFRIDAVSLPWLGTLDLGLLALPATMFWFVAVMNAVNLIDGLDGLASGVAFIACVSNFVIGWMNDALLVVLLSAALGGAVLGFLVYNFNPASIFLGDTGSLFLGFVLAATSLLGSSIKSSTTVSLLVPILALGLPIMDTLFAMVRRWLERRPIFAPDRGHIHHKLLDLGLTHRRAVLVLYCFSSLLAAGAVLVALGRSWEIGGTLVFVALAILGFVRASRLFAGVRRDRDHLSTSPYVESLSGHVLRVIQELGNAQDEAAALSCVERFVARANFASLSIEAPGSTLTFGDGEPTRGARKVSVRSLAFTHVVVRAEYNDEWSGSRSDVALLLRVVADAVGPYLPEPERHRVDSRKLAPVQAE